MRERYILRADDAGSYNDCPTWGVIFGIVQFMEKNGGCVIGPGRACKCRMNVALPSRSNQVTVVTTELERVSCVCAETKINAPRLHI